VMRAIWYISSSSSKSTRHSPMSERTTPTMRKIPRRRVIRCFRRRVLQPLTHDLYLFL
jgi:hypothetical protein